MSLRDTIRKAASLVVELPPEPMPLELKSSDIDLDDWPDTELPPGAQLPDAYSEQNAEAANLNPVEFEQMPANLGGENALDFAGIYAAANLPVTQFGADEMQNVLCSMPADVPLQTKRVTVKAVLGGMTNMGASPENIVGDASRKLAALEAFRGFMERKTGQTIETSQTEIAQLEKQIEARRRAMENAQSELARVTQECQSEAESLKQVLEFFSLDEVSN